MHEKVKTNWSEMLQLRKRNRSPLGPSVFYLSPNIEPTIRPECSQEHSVIHGVKTPNLLLQTRRNENGKTLPEQINATSIVAIKFLKLN